MCFNNNLYYLLNLYYITYLTYTLILKNFFWLKMLVAICVQWTLDPEVAGLDPARRTKICSGWDCSDLLIKTSIVHKEMCYCSVITLLILGTLYELCLYIILLFVCFCATNQSAYRQFVRTLPSTQHFIPRPCSVSLDRKVCVGYVFLFIVSK